MLPLAARPSDFGVALLLPEPTDEPLDDDPLDGEPVASELEDPLRGTSLPLAGVRLLPLSPRLDSGSLDDPPLMLPLAPVPLELVPVDEPPVDEEVPIDPDELVLLAARETPSALVVLLSS